MKTKFKIDDIVIRRYDKGYYVSKVIEISVINLTVFPQPRYKLSGHDNAYFNEDQLERYHNPEGEEL